MIGITSTKIFSTLGSNSSLIPLGIKDVANTAGMTAGSYVTGNSVEGKDRFMDEFGTQIIWLMGIPVFKKIIDKTVYKAAKFNPDIDVRILKNKDIFQKAKEHAAPELQDAFDKVLKHEKTFKGLAVAKFAAATALTLASYSALTIFRHKQTEKAIVEEFKKEHAEKIKKAQEQKQESGQKPSFGMNLEPLKQFMFDPVKNTMIIDGGITTERLAESRNPQDFVGYVVKEGGFWASMYFLGPWVQNKIEQNSAKKNKPIDLDIRILQDEEFQQAIKNKTIETDLKEFSTNVKDVELYDSLFDKSDNLVVKMAKKAEIISVLDEKNTIDSTKFIDLDQIRGTKKQIGIKQKIENFYKAAHSPENGDIDKFISKAINTKRWSIIKNMAASIGALGLIVPGIIVAMRYMDKGNKEFQVKKEIHEKLKKEHNLA